jgi:hypothetical protein
MLALFPITAVRIAKDWARLARTRRLLGISLLTVPYHAGIVLFIRLVELAGGVSASVRKRAHAS